MNTNEFSYMNESFRENQVDPNNFIHYVLSERDKEI